MNTEHRQLLTRIESFQFDRPDSPLTFSARLARDNGWTLHFALRALREYRRFTFLAVAAGHPVTPSDQVDQVWHEHLTYTRSYWDEFCREVLRRPLHHEPTRGGSVEGRKFDDWYGRTRESYREFFGEEPPADLWPLAQVRFGEDVHYSRINTSRNWVIPKPRWLRPAMQAAAALVCAALVAGCGAIIASGLGPLDYRGPEFLSFFWTLALAVFVAALILRRHLRAPGLELGEEIPALDPYGVALLNGGRTMAMHAALAQLYHHGGVDFDTATGVFKPKREPAANAPEIEKATYSRIAGLGSAKASSVESFVTPALTMIEDELRRVGLLLLPDQANRARWQPFLLVLAVILFGGLKIWIGLGRDKPVGFLVMSCLVLLVIALAVFLRRPHRTRKGDAHLAGLRVKHSELRHLPANTATAFGSAVPLAVGLFGYGVLADTDMASLHNVFRPPNRGSDGSSGCGADGGSGGGGGCGGGGCGGCGGGD